MLLFLLLALVAQAAVAAERLPNGLRLLTKPSTASGVVSAVLLLDYSAVDEPVEQLGLRQVLVTSMLQGSAAIDGTTLRRRLAALGGRMEGHVYPEVIAFTVTLPAQALPEALEALAEIACRPRLTDAGVTLALERARLELRRPPETADEGARRLAQQLLYAGHPFAVGGIGTAASLAAITPADVRNGYTAFVTPERAVLSVAGRCTPDATRALAQARFGAWAGPARRPRGTLKMPALDESRLELREQPVQTSCVMLSFPVPGAAHPDNIPLRLLDVLLAGGTGSRLFRSVREQQHLAYETDVDFPVQAASATFSLYAMTRNRYLEETKQALVDALTRLQTEPVPADELARAKAYLKSQYLLSHQYSARTAFDLAWYEMLDLGSDYDARMLAVIDALTAKDLQRVARAYFTHYYVIVVMPSEHE